MRLTKNNLTSPEAELSFLSSLMKDRNISKKTQVSEKHFSSPAHADVFNAIITSNSSDEAIIIRNTKKENSYEVIKSLTSKVNDSGNWKEYESIIIDKYARREMVKQYNKAVEDIMNGKDMSEIHISEIKSFKKEYGIGVTDIMQSIADYTDKVCSSDDLNIETGVQFLDDTIGGFGEGYLAVIGAPSGYGKSAFATQIAGHISIKHPMLYISMEMDEKQLSFRWLAQDGLGANSYLKRKAHIDGVNICGKFGEYADKRKTIRVSFEKSLDDIKRCIEYNMSEFNTKVIFIDYLQLIQVRGLNVEYSPELISEVTNGLKSFVESKGICVILLSQLNDKGEFFGSSAIKNSVDVAIKILKQLDDEKNEVVDGRIIVIDKNRHGKKGEKSMYFNGDRQLLV